MSGSIRSNETFRRAVPSDSGDISRVLIRSIKELCYLDHQGDAAKIADWCANKSPDHVLAWLESGAGIWVCEDASTILGVGGLRCEEITLLYLHPNAVGRGVGKALLSHLESAMLHSGVETAKLSATKTGLPFYLPQGWAQTGGETSCGQQSCLEMQKTLAR